MTRKPGAKYSRGVRGPPDREQQETADRMCEVARRGGYFRRQKQTAASEGLALGSRASL